MSHHACRKCSPTRTPTGTACVTAEPCNPLSVDAEGCLAAPAEHTSITVSAEEGPLFGMTLADVAGTPEGHNIVDTELGVLVISNPSPCRPMAFSVTAFGTARAIVDPANTLVSQANEARIDFRVNGGPWLAAGTAQVRSIEAAPSPYAAFSGEQGHTEIVIPPGGTLTIDRAAAFYWEQDIIIAATPDSLEFGLPGFVVHGTTA